MIGGTMGVMRMYKDGCGNDNGIVVDNALFFLERKE